jgi:hypothetical protein
VKKTLAEPNPTSAHLVRDLAPYVEARRRRQFDTVLPRADVALVRDLTWVERATARISVAAPTNPPEALDLLGEARLRLALFDARGLLDRMSGQEIADNLTRVFWPNPSRLASKGWALLAALDTADMVEVTISTVDPTNSLAYYRTRLRTRVAGLKNQMSRMLEPA